MVQMIWDSIVVTRKDVSAQKPRSAWSKMEHALIAQKPPSIITIINIYHTVSQVVAVITGVLWSDLGPGQRPNNSAVPRNPNPSIMLRSSLDHSSFW